MTQDRSEGIERIKDVELEHSDLRIAVDRLLIAARSNPANIQGDVEPISLAEARRHLCRDFSDMPPSW